MKIKFNNTTYETDKEIPLIKACFAVKAPITFGCRIGMCGTCKVTIHGDLSNVSDKNEAEEDFTDKDNERLACQCVVKGDIEVEQ